MEALFYLSDLLATLLLMWWAVKKTNGGPNLAIFRLLDYKENAEQPAPKDGARFVSLAGRPLAKAGAATTPAMAWRDTGWSKAERRNRRTQGR